jgi:hypothetical protein
MSELRSRPLFKIEIALHPVQELGATPLRQRRIAPVSGGRFAGERLRGVVLPHGGGDWIVVRTDGAFQLDVRLTLQTDDGALIYMSYRGVRDAPAEVAAQLGARRAGRPGSVLFPHRTVLRDGNGALRMAQQRRGGRRRRTLARRRDLRSL